MRTHLFVALGLSSAGCATDNAKNTDTSAASTSDEDLADLEATVQALATRLDAAEVARAELEAELSASQEEVAQLQAELDALDYASRADVGALADRVATVEADYLTAESLEAYATQTWVSDQEYATQADLAAYAPQSELNGLNDRVAAVESSYATATALHTVESALTTVESAVATIQADYLQAADLDAYATEANLDALDVRVSTIEADYATWTDLDSVDEALDTRVSLLEQIEGLDTSIVFLTSTRYTPATDFASLEDADALCQAEADAAGLYGTFMAWLSDSTDSPSTRFNTTLAPYTLVDGTEVAADWSSLTSSNLQSAISQSASGSNIGSLFNTWTGTKRNGTVDTLTCSDWTDAAANGIYGSGDETNYAWTGSNGTIRYATGCSTAMRLYCFRQ